MIRVTVEIVPQGQEDQKKFISLCEIWNETTGTTDSGNYRFRISKEDPTKNITIGEIKGFSRLTKSVWHLLYEVLKEAYVKKARKK